MSIETTNPLTQKPLFGIYVHWPFCAAKCPYCDFNSHVRHQKIDQSAYVSAYLTELKYFAERTQGQSVTSIFFGGGTPSLMEEKTVENILNAISSYWAVDENVEITLEANPTSVEAERFRGYRKNGVNRVSLGVQSLDDDQLKFLGRMHTVDQAMSAISTAREIFDRMSFDLIYARPDQTLDNWQNELEKAIGLAADHLSLYQLTIESGTPFFELHKKGRLKIPDNEQAAQLYELTQHITARQGLDAYEISNHASPGAQCLHNLTYWRYENYVGTGPGAHGRLTIDGRKHATVCESNPENWLSNVLANGQGLIENQVLQSHEMADEFLVMGLRLREGISLDRYAEMGGGEFKSEKLEFLKNHGFIEFMKNGNLRATPQGFLVLDAVVADLAG